MDPITLESSRPVGPGTTQTPLRPPLVRGEAGGSFGELTTEDFFSLLISQLTNQDPFEPTGNEELLQQISSIRDIELSTKLTESLDSLLGHERFSSASALIGRYVTSLPDEQGNVQAGVTVGVRVDASGTPILQLSGGAELSLDRVDRIESARQAAESLIGKQVSGVDGRNASDPQLVEGVVLSVAADETGEMVLELDTGDSLPLADVFGVNLVES